MSEVSDLTALVGSRICHDLISPLGAIGNGMELLAMAAAEEPGGAPSEELALIADSVARANGRIRMFRLAFGAAGQGVEIAGRELCEILAEYYGGGRLSVTAEPPVAMSRALAKAALLAILCSETALPRGGRIALQGAGEVLTLAAEGPRVDLAPDLWGPLSRGRTPDCELSAAQVQFALLPIALAEAGRRLDLRQGDARFDLTF